jgi:hypothetical protein
VQASTVGEILAFKPAAGAIADPTELLGRYFEATERIWEYVDGWKRR